MSLVKPSGIQGLDSGHPLNANIAEFFEFGQTNKELVSDIAFTHSGTEGNDADLGDSVLFTETNIGTTAQMSLSNNNTILLIFKHVGSDAGHAGTVGAFRFLYGEGNGDAFEFDYQPTGGVRYEATIRANYSAYSDIRYDPYDNPGYSLPYALAFSFDATAADPGSRTLYLNGSEEAASATETAIEQAFAVDPVTVDLCDDAGATGDTRVAAIVRFNKRLSAAEMASVTNDPWAMVSTGAPADTTPPTFDTAPNVTATTETGHSIAATLNEAGTIYGVRLANGATAPSAAQVKAGQDSTGSAALEAKSGAAVNSATLTFSTGSASTAYDYYILAEDDEGTPNVQASPTLVEATTAATQVPGISDITVQKDNTPVEASDWELEITLASNGSEVYSGSSIASSASGVISAITTTGGSVGDSVRVEGYSPSNEYSFIFYQNLEDIA